MGLFTAMQMVMSRKIFRTWEDTLNIKNVQPNNLSWDTSYGGWQFTDVSNSYLWIIIQMEHEKFLGGSLYFHLHWMPTTAAAGNVHWELEYWWKNAAGDTAQGASGTGTVLDLIAATNGTAYVLQVDSFTAIAAPSSEAPSSIFTGVVRRVSDAQDTYNGATALLKDYDGHTERDSWGSWSEFNKWG